MRVSYILIKKFLAGMIALSLLVFLCACGSGASTGYINKDEATNIALKQLDGGVLHSISLSALDGATVYTGSMTKDGVEYRFDIDAENGIVLRFGTVEEVKQEEVANNPQKSSSSASATVESSSPDGYIGSEAAVAICLVSYPVAMDNSVALSEHNGTPAYIVNLTVNGSTFDLYVDAITGELLND